MNYCRDGRKGSGKTLLAVLDIIKHIAKGGCVVTNILIKVDGWDCPITKQHHLGAKWYLKAYYRWALQEGQLIYLTEDQMKEFYKFVPSGTWKKNVLVVIDEASEWFDSMDRKGADDKTLNYMRQNRKFNVEVCFITQDFSFLNKRLRDLTSHVLATVNMQHVLWPVIRLPLSPVPCVKETHYDKYGTKLVLNDTHKVFPDKGLYGCYNTFETFTKFDFQREDVQTDFSGEGSPERKKMNWMWKAAVLVTMVSSGLTFWQVRGLGLSGSGAVSVGGAAVVAVEDDDRMRIVHFESFSNFEGMVDVYILGVRYRAGTMCPEGLVKQVTREHVIVQLVSGVERVYVNGLRRSTVVPAISESTVEARV